MNSQYLALVVPDALGDRSSVTRDRVANAAGVAFALSYGATAVLIGDAPKPSAAIPWPLDVALGLLCAAALLFRRRWPVQIAALTVALGVVSVMSTGAAIVAIFTVAIRRRNAIAFLFYFLFVLTGPIYHYLQPVSDFPVLVDVIARIVTGLVPWGWGSFVQANRQLTGSLRQHAARLENEQQLRVERAKLTERTRIAREMHDVLAHRMSLASLHAGALEVRPDARPEEIAFAAGAIRRSIHEALTDLRTVIGVLRENASGLPEPPQPDIADIPALVDTARSGGMAVDFDVELPEEPPTLLGRTAYRLVQEGLTNARKHAPGVAVEVTVDRTSSGDLRIRICNALSATATSTVPGAGMGLVGITERVELAGGRVEYGAENGQYRLEAWLPWK